MPELIDRQAVRLLESDADAYTENWNDDYEKGFCDAINKVLKLPTIEAEPVRKGRWKGWTTSKFTGKYKDYDEPEFKDYVYYTCSECYRKSAIQELYCPRCGARMDGGDDNAESD